MALPGLAAATPDTVSGATSVHDPGAGHETREAPLKFSLLTCGPGREIYELEGHTALRVQTPGYDRVVSWGLFDFDEPGFVFRFVIGRTDYACGAFDTGLFVNEYVRQGRWVVEQELDLTPGQAARLLSLVDDNLRPENCKYRYKYLTDNCATRPYNLIEEAVGHPLLQTEVDVAPEGDTYRDMMTNYHSNYPWYQFGIDLVLGAGLDRKLTQREKAFAPIYLRQMLSRTYHVDDDSVRRQIVKSQQVLYRGADGVVTDGPTPLPLTPAFIAWVICILAIALSLRDIGIHRLTRWFDATLYTVYGVIGAVATFLLCFSQHEATSSNWLILWLNPLSLVVPFTIYSRYRRIIGYYQVVNLVMIVALLVISIMQYRALNAAFYPLIAADLSRCITWLTLFNFKKKPVQ